MLYLLSHALGIKLDVLEEQKRKISTAQIDTHIPTTTITVKTNHSSAKFQFDILGKELESELQFIFLFFLFTNLKCNRFNN